MAKQEMDRNLALEAVRVTEAAALAASVSDTPWEALMLAVDFKGGTVREYAEGST